VDNKKKIGDFFNEGIQDTGLEPNIEVWSKINETLNKKKKRRFFWFTLASLIFVTVVLYYTFFQILPNYQNNTTIKSHPTPTINKDAFKGNTDNYKKEKPYPSKNKHSNNTSETTSNKSLEKNKNSSDKNINKKKIINTKKNQNTSTKYKTTTNNLTKGSKNKSNDIDVLNNTSKDTISTLKDSINNNYLINKETNDSIAKKNKDSLKIKKKRTRRLKKPLEEEPIKKDSLSLSKLDITVQFSPIVSRYLTDRNFLIPETQITNKQVRLSYSYRLLLTIPIKERLNLRLGIAHQEFRYNAEFIPNINATNNYGGIITSNTNFNLNSTNQNLLNDLASETPVNLEHKIRYLQFPFELKYKLKEEKIGINLISGFDFFVLQDDDIKISSTSTNNFFAGRANFLSNFSVAVHGGIGFEYPVSKILKLQVEPTIIYQIGGYKNNVRNPNPLYLSIYTSFNLRF